MPKQISMAQRTINLTGWSKEQYEKNLKVYSNRFRNYNRATGTQTTVTPSQSFYYTLSRQKQGITLTERQANILNFTSATNKSSRARIEETATLKLEKFESLAEVNKGVRKILNSNLSNTEKIAKATEYANRLQDLMNDSKERSEFIGSDTDVTEY